MSTSSENDWRAEALRQMELADQGGPTEYVDEQATWSVSVVCIKLVILAVLAVPMVCFLGYTWLFALFFLGWLLFSIR